MSNNFDNRNMNANTALKELGLSEPESAVYLALLRLGGSIASEIAKEVGLKRTTIYAILKSLAAKGFVAMYFRKNKQLYYAERPSRVSNYFEKKLRSFNELIPSLESLHKKELQVGGLRFIETIEELKKFYEDVLDDYKNKSYFVISSGKEWEDLDPEFFQYFRSERGRRNIKTKLLLSPHFKEENPEDAELKRTWKFLPKKYEFKSTIDIYKDKILIVSPELSALAVVIAVPAMVDVFKMVFEIIWDMVE